MGIYFRSVLKTVLIIQGCFFIPEKCFHSIKAYSALHSSKQPAGTQESGRGYIQESWSQLTKLPYHVGIVLSTWRRRKEAGDIWSWDVCLLKPPLCVREPCFPHKLLAAMCNLFCRKCPLSQYIMMTLSKGRSQLLLGTNWIIMCLCPGGEREGKLTIDHRNYSQPGTHWSPKAASLLV